jgi:hypothetical protein
MVRVGVGVHCRSGVADAFDKSGPAGFRAVFLAQQFYGLAIDVRDEPFNAYLAGGDADFGPFGQFARRFIPGYQ